MLPDCCGKKPNPTRTHAGTSTGSRGTAPPTAARAHRPWAGGMGASINAWGCAHLRLGHRSEPDDVQSAGRRGYASQLLDNKPHYVRTHTRAQAHLRLGHCSEPHDVCKHDGHLLGGGRWFRRPRQESRACTSGARAHMSVTWRALKVRRRGWARATRVRAHRACARLRAACTWHRPSLGGAPRRAHSHDARRGTCSRQGRPHGRAPAERAPPAYGGRPRGSFHLLAPHLLVVQG